MSEKDFYKQVKIIDDAIVNGVLAPPVLKLIKEKSYNDYFFKKITNIEWFTILKKENYFSAHNAPRPIQSEGGNLFIIPEWNVLRYLEHISRQADLTQKDKYIDELFNIIREVTKYHIVHNRILDNYRTWWYFTKILCNIPTSKIPPDIVGLIKEWLDFKFDTDLQGAEIATKLLPKFLNSNAREDWKKAEKIIEVITDIKWVPIPEEQRNILERDAEPKTLIKPYWLRKAFEKNAGRIGEICTTDIISVIAKRILDIFREQYPHSYDITHNDKNYQITHALLEENKHRISLYSLKYPENWDGFSTDKIEKTPLLSFDITVENKSEFIAKIKKTLIEKIFPELDNEFDEVLSSISFLYDHSYIWFSSLYASSDSFAVRIDDAEKVLVFALKEVLKAKARNNVEETRKVLDEFLSKAYPYPLFKRLILFIAGIEWDKYKRYFFEGILTLEEVRCFEESDYETELSVLLKTNFSKFSADEKEIIKDIITTGPQHIPSENPEKYKAYWRQKWLSLMKEDPVFASLYKKQQEITNIDKEKFSFGVEIKASEGFGPSPLTAEEILNLNNADLAIKLKEFKSEKKWGGKTVTSFSVVLNEAVRTNPSKFIEDLSQFEDVGFIYVYRILDGIKEEWKEKKAVDWGKVFEFIISYIDKEKFWKDEYVVEKGAWPSGADREWIIGVIAELIRDGTKDDAWAFPEEHFEKAQKIIFLILDKLDIKEEKDMSDFVTYTLNSSLGKVITALIYLSLRIARVNDKKGIKEEIKWPLEVRAKYEEILKKKITEGYTLLGQYFPNLYYLDKRWVEEKIESLENEKGSRYWEAFMDGYLSIERVYDDLYDLTKPHYQYGLIYDFKERRNREHLIQHVCIGYLRNREKIDDPDSLFRKVIDAWKPEQIREVISFFWMQRNYLKDSPDDKAIKNRIISFWKWVYENKYKGKSETELIGEDRTILSNLAKLTTFLPKIDSEKFDWLMLSAPYINEDYNSPFFIEYLDNYEDKKNIGYIGEIFLKMLDSFTPDYDQEHIRSIVEKLYLNEQTDNAGKICNIYGMRGYEFLRDIRDIYEKNR